MHKSIISNKIIQLKRAKNSNPEWTIQKIVDESGVSKSTITRMFADGSEEQSFRYESVKAVAELLLPDGMGVSLDEEEMEMQISMIREKYEAKLEKEREANRKQTELLMNQMNLKDNRIDELLAHQRQLINALDDRASQFKELYQKHNEVMSQLLANKELINEVLRKEK